MTEIDQKHALGLSTAQVAGSALAAITTAVVASWAGTAGTLIGAALGSVVATVGTATYTWSLRRTGDVVRRRGTTRVVDPVPVRSSRLPSLPWGRLGIAAAVAALVALAGITVVEAVGGKPVSAYTGGSSGSGTTLGHVTGADTSAKKSTPSETPTPAPSPTPSPSETPTPTPTPTPTEEPSPSVVPSVPVPSEQPSVTPTP